MKTYIAAAALAMGADALIAARDQCCFELNASGGPGGPVGQLDDGQNRIGQNLPSATYCLNNGAITDGNGRGCILTPPTTQFQCDAGAAPTGGFAVDCHGDLTHDGSSKFYSCPTGDNGGYNVYTTPVSGQNACVEITLSTGGKCHGACPKTAPTSGSGAPAQLPAGSFEYPHLITPISSAKPDHAFGTSYNGQATPEWSTIFNFDVPAADAGKECTLEFLFPTQDQLQTSSYTFSGAGGIEFSSLKGIANSGTTYNNAPKAESSFGTKSVTPGHAITVGKFPCPAGQTVSYEMKSTDGTSLTYFQDYNPAPIGLYLTVA